MGPGRTEVDRCIPCYSNGVHSGGWLGPGGGAGYRDDSRNQPPSSRYAAGVEQGLSLEHLVPSPSETWFRGMSVGGSFRRV